MPKEKLIDETVQAETTAAPETTAPETASTQLVCPHCGGVIEITTPAHTRRGQLTGLSLEEMTDEQINVEMINAKSVLYKAEKRGAGQDTILKNKARVDAVTAEKAKRHPVAPVVEAAPVEINEAVAQEV